MSTRISLYRADYIDISLRPDSDGDKNPGVWWWSLNDSEYIAPSKSHKSC